MSASFWESDGGGRRSSRSSADSASAECIVSSPRDPKQVAAELAQGLCVWNVGAALGGLAVAPEAWRWPGALESCSGGPSSLPQSRVGAHSQR